MSETLPVGKLPAELLARLLAAAPTHDPRLLVGPGIGMDCAVIDASPELLVFKSDPITFATDEIGWYAVQVNANDIVTTGATPRWFLATVLLPEGQTDMARVELIAGQLAAACRELGVTLIGGHTEITYGLDRPIISGTMIGEVPRERLVTPRGVQPGDRLLLTKGVPVEATAILAREFPERLAGALAPEELRQAQGYLHVPGISVVRDARLALQAGAVHAMHDPTEGGLLTAVWELALAAGLTAQMDPAGVPVPDLAARVCHALGLNPLGAIASGALLLAVAPGSVEPICRALEGEGIPCAEIGALHSGPAVAVDGEGRPLPRPERDEIARLF